MLSEPGIPCLRDRTTDPHPQHPIRINRMPVSRQHELNPYGLGSAAYLAKKAGKARASKACTRCGLLMRHPDLLGRANHSGNGTRVICCTTSLTHTTSYTKKGKAAVATSLAFLVNRMCARLVITDGVMLPRRALSSHLPKATSRCNVGPRHHHCSSETLQRQRSRRCIACASQPRTGLKRLPTNLRPAHLQQDLGPTSPGPYCWMGSLSFQRQTRSKTVVMGYRGHPCP